MANIRIQPGEIVVNDRGITTSLNRIRTHRYDRYIAEESPSGRIVLTPVVSVSAAELERLSGASKATLARSIAFLKEAVDQLEREAGAA